MRQQVGSRNEVKRSTSLALLLWLFLVGGMEDTEPLWKPSLDAITGARHGGQTDNILDQLRALADEFPHVAEIAYQLAWTLDSLDQPAAALALTTKPLLLSGWPLTSKAGALVGLGNCLRIAGELDRAAETLSQADASRAA